MEYKDYYKIMGLSSNASEKEIKTAYRKLARKYHPDINKEANAEEKFKELGEAYEVLKDPKKRAIYDQSSKNWDSAQSAHQFSEDSGWQGENINFGDNSDFFEALFGASRRRQHSMKGEDYSSNITISLEDAFHGATRQIQIPIQQLDKEGRLQVINQTLKVKIPAGIKSGQQIRIAGYGAPGLGNGPKGDLYLKVNIEKHPHFEAKNEDIYSVVPITPWEAALGANIQIPTLGGKVELKIPAGSQGGQTFRLKGRGLPSTKPGDQYVMLKIVIPQPKTDAAKALYKTMSEQMPFNPREQMGS